MDDELDPLVGEWLSLAEAAQRLGVEPGRVRRLLEDRLLVAVRSGRPAVVRIPAALIRDGAPLPELRGTLTVLGDAGFSDADAVRWLFTPDDTLPGTPVEALAAGRKTEIRRRAQASAF